MSVRSFTVFQDTEPDVVHPSAPSTDITTTLLSTLAAIEKENLHPLTGLRPGPTIGSEAKKRKTAALATKVLLVPPLRKKGEKKLRKPLGSKHKSSDPKKKSSRKASPLPPVAEEQELRQPPRLSVSQLNIDSRCYELTVSPLADVSEAYDSTRESQESDVHTERENSVEPAIRDYFSPSMAKKPLPTMNETTVDPSLETSDFSTPERKRIYSAFTFSSPSPTSERFKQAHTSPAPRDVPECSL